MKADILIIGGPVATMDAGRRAFDAGYVAISGTSIVGVGAAADCPYTARRTYDARRMATLPGLINCHTHLSNSISRGLFDELPLADWVSQGMWPSLRASTSATAYAGARAALVENILGGVTTMVVGEFGRPDPGTLDGVLRAVRESGARAVVARMAVDSSDESDPSQSTATDVRDSIDGALQEVDRLRALFNSELIEVVPEPLGVLRCTSDMIREFTAYARAHQSRMTMHVASSQDEIVESQRRFGMGPIERLSELDALGDHLLIAHCVLPTAEEITLLAMSRTGVSHNPVSNLMYAAGIAPLSEMLSDQVRVGLGTDGASTNNGQNIWETMKFAIFLQKHRFGASWGSAELALELATIGGAHAIGMADSIGSLEVGKRADVILVDIDRPALLPESTWMSNLVYSPDPSAVRTVIVNGVVVAEADRVSAWSTEEVVAAGHRAAATMDRVTGLARAYRGRTGWNWHR